MTGKLNAMDAMCQPYSEACFRVAQSLRSGTGLPTGMPRDQSNADAVKFLKLAAELGGACNLKAEPR